MLKLHKQWSGGNSFGEKDTSMQTIKQQLLREAFQLQTEQKELAGELKEAEECERTLKLLRKQLAERNQTSIESTATA